MSSVLRPPSAYLVPLAALVLALGLGPTLPLPGQEQHEPSGLAKLASPAQARQGPALVIKTARPEIARDAARSFGFEGEWPKQSPNQHYVIALDEAGKPAVTQAEGKVDHLEVLAHPPALMELFGDKIEEQREMITGRVALAMSPMGIKTKDAVEIVQALLEFPKQVHAAELRLVGNPDKFKSEGMEVWLRLSPVKDTWFHKAVTALQPAPGGAPVLGAEEAQVSAAIAVDGKNLIAVCTPFLEVAGRMGAKSEGESKRNEQVLGRMLEQLEGSLAFVMSVQAGAKAMIALKDGATMRKILESPESVEMMQAQGAMNPLVEVSYQPKVFEHRGVSVDRSKGAVKEGAPENPMLPDGLLTTYVAIASNWLVEATYGAKEEDLKKLIDQVLDQQVKRSPLGSGVCARVDLKLRQLFSELSAKYGGATNDADIPETLRIQLLRSDDSLRLKVHAK